MVYHFGCSPVTGSFVVFSPSHLLHAAAGTHLSHGEIAIIISCFVGVIFVVSLVLVLRNTGQRGRSHSDGSLTASMASSVSRLIHRGSSNKQPLLKDTDME